MSNNAEGFREVYLDLHVHLGWSGIPGGGVKISAARDLTLAGILRECRERKGIQMIGVIDAATTGALADMERLLASGTIAEQPGGGFAYSDGITLIPGAEVEVVHEGKPVHLLCYVGSMHALRELAAWSSRLVKNAQLSTQRHHGTTAAEVVSFVGDLDGFVIPAHIFTPHKAALSASRSISALIPPELWRYVPAVELGLSSDTALADRLAELAAFSFVTNSDAHSMAKIGREYNRILVADLTFTELAMALRGAQGRRITANFGLDPRLGKYHRTYCLACAQRLEGAPPVLACTLNPDHRLVLGVLDRIEDYRSRQAPGTGRPRPPYIHQVPLQFVPGLGKRSLDRLLAAFGTEMGVLHQTSPDELTMVVGERLARLIVAAREGTLAIEAGGGGVYGRVLAET